MKHFFLLFLLFLLATTGQAQITNANVNYELYVDQVSQSCNNDNVSSDDNEVRIGLSSDANAGGTATWTSGGDGASCGGNLYVFRWQADAPSTITRSNRLLYRAINRNNASNSFNIFHNSWEEDDTPDCDPSGDACQSSGTWTITFKSGAKTPNRFWSNDGTAGVASFVTGQSGNFSAKTVWRYTNGNACNNALNFGTLASGTTYSHLNSNRTAPAGASGDLGYTNTLGNSANDVYYQFTLSSSATVTISTNNAGSNYDTYLRLYNSTACGTQIASNDDAGGGTNSIITRELCAGTYVILVEGFSANTGDFNLSVNAVNYTVSGGTIGGATTTICTGADAGAFSSITNATGVSGVSYQWEQSTVGAGSGYSNIAGATANIYDIPTLPQTTWYRRRATDGCGQVAYSNVVQITVNTLSTAPTAITGTSTICNGSSTTLTVSGGSLGTGGVFRWYSGSCGGTLVGTGSSITVSPTANTAYFVRAEGTCNTTACATTTVNVNTLSTAPTAITGTSTICNGNSTTLTVSGGSLGTGGVFRWYSGSCGGTLVGTGNSITVSPSTNTAYFVRAEGTCNTTACATTTVNVNTLSTAPTAITGTSTICNGNSTTVTVSGGSLGTGGVFRWYSGSCGGTLVGTGNSITVSPSTNTAYFVRAEGTCNTTACATTTVNVNTLSTAPTAITGTSTICNGNSTTLTVSGGSLGTGGVFRWYSGSCGGTLVGTGNSITVSPSTNTAYFVRAEGTCNTTACATTTVNVNTLSTAPTAITGTSTICNGNSTTLTVSGGSLGTGGVFRWYSGSCGGTLVGTGNSITVSPSTNTAYFVRAEGTCNTTACATTTVNVNTLSTAPTAITGTSTICNGNSTTLTVSGGSLGTGGVFRWYSGSCGGTLVGTGNSITVSPSTNTAYFVRAEGTCNTTACATTTVNVNVVSTATTIDPAPAITCPNTTIVLTTSGGVEGTGAVTRWYSAPNGGGTLLNTGNNLTITPASTTTYYARREDACVTTSDASMVVNVRDFVYAANNTNASTYCTDNSGWHHFYNGNQIILSLQGDLSGVGSMTATIRTNSTYYQDRPSGSTPLNCATNWSPGEERFEMARNWNISYTGTLNGSYNVRYYYPMSERNAVETAAQNWATTYPACGYTYKYNPANNGWFWFKNTSGTYTAPVFEDIILASAANGVVGTTNYSEITGITSFSGGTGAVILVPDNRLPVELLNFDGVAQNGGAKLWWATASERNSSHFDVERSSNGVDFESIGRVVAQGNSSIIHNYDFFDARPNVGINYYRLRQVDNDGAQELSNIVAVEIEALGKPYRFYPNPTDGQIRYQFYSEQADDVQIEVLNSLGQVVLRQSQSYAIGGHELSIDMSSLTPAAYVVRAYHESGKTTHSEVIIYNRP